MAITLTQGVHHITLNGANRQTSVDFWQDVMGMPLVFEQPNLDDLDINHLYFDPGDGRLITVFTHESRKADRTPNPGAPGNLHHLAFATSRENFDKATANLRSAGFKNSGPMDRGFMDSLYFRDPLGQLMELACYKFSPPDGHTHADVLSKAHEIRVAAGAIAILEKHLRQAIQGLQQVWIWREKPDRCEIRGSILCR